MVLSWYGDGREEVGWKGKAIPPHPRRDYSTAYYP